MLWNPRTHSAEAARSSTRWAGLHSEWPAGLLMASQSCSGSGSVWLGHRSLCGPAEPASQRQRTGFVPVPATFKDHRVSFRWALTPEGTLAMSHSYPGSPKSCQGSGLELCQIWASCVGFQFWMCVKAGVCLLQLLWWWRKTRGCWRCDWGVVVGHKQDSWDSGCKDFFSCSVWLPLWRTEYLRENRGRLFKHPI